MRDYHMNRKEKLLIILIGSLVALAVHFSAIAAVDAPHNEANNISCGNLSWSGTAAIAFLGRNHVF